MKNWFFFLWKSPLTKRGSKYLRRNDLGPEQNLFFMQTFKNEFA